jgi:hypothetical protein
MNGIDPNWLPSQGKTSSKYCLRTLPPGKPLPPIPRTRHDKRRIKAQARASARNVARLEALASGFKQLTPASPQSIQDLAATFNRRA